MSAPASGLRAAALVLSLAIAQATGGSLLAAQGTCTFGEGTANLSSITIADGSRITYVTQPRIRCTDGVRIQADSAVAYSAQSMSHLIGNVRFQDATRDLRADDARYFSQQARLQAQGSLFVRDTVQGSIIENGDLLYLRKASFRPVEEMTVTTGVDGVRPRASLTMEGAPGATGDTLASTSRPGDSAGAPAAPYVVEADVIFFLGDGYFRAHGDVVIDRDSLLAFGDSAEYDRTAGHLRIGGSARIEGAAYDLSGQTIVLAVPNGDLTGVRAIGDGVLVGEDLRVTSPVIDVAMEDGSMDRLVAVPLPPNSADVPANAAPGADAEEPARPVVLAGDFRLVADSIEVEAPSQVVERIFAAGRARSESTARDSLNVEALPALARSDWIEGDTVIATFVRTDSVPEARPDSTRSKFRLDQLVARGSARSLYRLLPEDSTATAGVDAPAVHFVTGAQITIVLDGGEVDRLEVEGETHGWHLEPRRIRAATEGVPAADSVGVPTGAAPGAPEPGR